MNGLLRLQVLASTFLQVFLHHFKFDLPVHNGTHCVFNNFSYMNVLLLKECLAISLTSFFFYLCFSKWHIMSTSLWSFRSGDSSVVFCVLFLFLIYSCTLKRAAAQLHFWVFGLIVYSICLLMEIHSDGVGVEMDRKINCGWTSLNAGITCK